MQNSTKIGFIGAGNMTYALVSGLINSGFSTQNIKLSDTNEHLLSLRANEFNLEVFTHNTTLAAQCDVIIFAIKPEIVSAVCTELREHIGHNPLLISIAAGVRMIDINRWLGGNASIVRTMPNTPALLGKGATGMVANEAVSDENKALAEQILNAVSSCLWVEDEKMLDIVTALSGSGPAYFFLLIESMTKAGVALGLDKSIAEQLSIQTAFGAGLMANTSTDSIHDLRVKVTSPNGTTQAAIESFHDQNFDMIVSHAMRAAFDRSREIGIEIGDNNG